MNRYQAELYHHGILGQKWGKRNGPPYPLKDSDHSAAERKAGWKKSTKKLEKEDANSYNHSKASLKRIGKAAAISSLAVIGGFALYKSGILDNRINKAKTELSGNDAIKHIGLQFFAERSGSLKPIRLPYREYKHVSSEITTHCVDQLKTKKVFSKRILHHIYTVRNNFDGTFDIVGKKKATDDILDYLAKGK